MEPPRLATGAAARAKRNSLASNMFSEFNLDVAPTIQPAQLATPGSDGSLQAGEPLVLLGDSKAG